MMGAMAPDPVVSKTLGFAVPQCTEGLPSFPPMGAGPMKCPEAPFIMPLPRRHMI